MSLISITFAPPVALHFPLPQLPLPWRDATPPESEERTFERVPVEIQIDPEGRGIRAGFPFLASALELYQEADFSAACADSPEEHAARVLQVLGSNPASALQALIDGSTQPSPPPRVPREIANWRAKAVLAGMGKLGLVDGLIAGMEEPQATVLRLAWNGNAALLRSSQTVASLAATLGMSAAEVDAFFIAADAITL
ncbi:MAG: hypothetical protein WCK77_14445 [Verrucomicrobiota bacterium]